MWLTLASVNIGSWQLNVAWLARLACGCQLQYDTSSCGWLAQ